LIIKKKVSYFGEKKTKGKRKKGKVGKQMQKKGGMHCGLLL
jgi:hypothetical protein